MDIDEMDRRPSREEYNPIGDEGQDLGCCYLFRECVSSLRESIEQSDVTQVLQNNSLCFKVTLALEGFLTLGILGCHFTEIISKIKGI